MAMRDFRDWRLAVLAAGLVLIGGCQRPIKARITDTLMSYGLDKGRAECVADRLSSNLSISQLVELNGAAQDYQRRVGAPVLSFPDLIDVGSKLDPKIRGELLSAGMTCAMPSIPL